MNPKALQKLFTTWKKAQAAQKKADELMERAKDEAIAAVEAVLVELATKQELASKRVAELRKRGVPGV